MIYVACISSLHAELNLVAFQEGFTKLWTGLGPNVARNAIINAAELASYDQVKQVGCHLPTPPVVDEAFYCVIQYCAHLWEKNVHLGSFFSEARSSCR